MIPIRVEVAGITVNVSQVVCEQVITTKQGKFLVLIFPFSVEQPNSGQLALPGSPATIRAPFQITISEEYIQPYREAVARAIQDTQEALSGVVYEDDPTDGDAPLDGIPSRN